MSISSFFAAAMGTMVEYYDYALFSIFRFYWELCGYSSICTIMYLTNPPKSYVYPLNNAFNINKMRQTQAFLNIS